MGKINSFKKNTTPSFCSICFSYWFIYTGLFSYEQLVHLFVILALPSH